ncbi:MAG: SUMF1/EgtB/PvdO family nonheme iron enzyme [Gemmatimonadetes bacterium]|jgi:formylglycine-generating enzyme required for sulfatase activity|nr:SUMF1/EgtB/PvdO family nonheme iron enzyme [Gemmatimonadota bacterium]
MRCCLLLLWIALPVAANPQITVQLPGQATMDFVWIEAGSFTMGMTAEHVARLGVILGGPFITDARAAPQMTAVIDTGFYLAKYEVTQQQWRAVSADIPWDTVDADDLPATKVSRAAADRLVAVLNERTTGGAYRLPTDAEWEYANRAGTTSLWYFGDEVSGLSDNAWYRDLTGPQPVGTKPGNPWGLHDMHGNVEEWTSDAWSSSGPYASCTGVTRGGHFAAGKGHGYLSTLPFMRQPKGCADFADDLPDDLFGAGLRLVFIPAGTTAIAQDTWGSVKYR